jgi:SAM-dependent methyltransferase
MFALRLIVPWLRKRHQLETMVGPVGFWNRLREYQLSVLTANGLEAHHSLLDIGCGPLQGGIAFIRYLNPGNYAGMDINPARIAAGCEQVAGKRLAVKKPTLLVSDCLKERELGNRRFDYIWMSQVLYYFSPERLHCLFEYIENRLAPQGVFLVDVLGPEHYETRFPEHGYYLHSAAGVRETAAQFGLQVQDLGEIRLYGYPARLSLCTNRLLRISRPIDS